MTVKIGYSDEEILFSDSYVVDVEVTIYSTSNKFYLKINEESRLFKVIERIYDIEETELLIIVV